MPLKEYISQTFPEHFVFFRPKDLVSGDFYWFKRINNTELDISIMAVVDCTGHGVPGAFMSMLGIASLNDIIIKKDKHTTASILNKLQRKVINNLGQHEFSKNISDGMDVALVLIDHKRKKLQFSGAYRDLYLIRNNRLEIIKGDRMPIGKNVKEDTEFTYVESDFFKDDIVYLFTDGFADQFGGANNTKYLRKNLQQFLVSICQYPMDEQKKLLNIELNGWMQKGDQTDDILVAGIKF